MSATLIEAATFDANIVVPVGTDKRKAASVVVAFQSLANRTRYLLSGFANILNGTAGAFTALVNTGNTVLGDDANTDTAVINAATNIGGVLTCLKQIVMSGSARIVPQTFEMTNADYTVTAGIASVYVASGSVSATRTVTLYSGALDGEWFHIKNDSSQQINIAPVGDVCINGTSGGLSYQRHAGVWRQMSHST